MTRHSLRLVLVAACAFGLTTGFINNIHRPACALAGSSTRARPSMRYARRDVLRRSKLNEKLGHTVDKDAFHGIVFSEDTEKLLQASSWVLRDRMLRKFRMRALELGVDFPQSFGRDPHALSRRKDNRGQRRAHALVNMGTNKGGAVGAKAPATRAPKEDPKQVAATKQPAAPPPPAPAPAVTTSPSPPLSIAASVDSQIKVAMKARDTARLTTLRNIKTALLNAMKEDGKDSIEDDKAMAVLRKLAKMRRESIDMYEQAGATERIAEERAELEVIEAYLPSLASPEQTLAWINEAIAAGASNVGEVMRSLMTAHKDEIDGKLAQQLVKEALAK